MKKVRHLFALLFMTSFIFTACNDDEPYVYVPDTIEGVVINNVRWATRNVDAPGTFAGRPESYGMFYQWNRRIGWSFSSPMTNSDGGTTWNSTNAAGTYWMYENDPCPEGWRVPTQAELTDLRNQPSIWITRNGVRGRVFGIVPNQIFLPATGWRGAGDGTLYNTGRTGFYWGSVQDLSFDNNGVHINSNRRAFGFSVRCVAED